MSKFKLASTIEVTVDVADEIIKKFFAVVPKVESFLNKCGKFGVKNNYIYTPVYKRRRFFDPNKSNSGEIERASKNSPIQGANGDMTKLALVYLMQVIRDYEGAKIVHCVHDEIQCEVPVSIATEFQAVMQDCMLRAAHKILTKVPMKVDCKEAYCWSK